MESLSFDDCHPYGSCHGGLLHRKASRLSHPTVPENRKPRRCTWCEFHLSVAPNHYFAFGNNLKQKQFFQAETKKYRKNPYFCDTFVINHKRQTEPLAVMAEEHPPSPSLGIPFAWEIAGQARNDDLESG